MALIVRACVFARRKLYFQDFNNWNPVLTYVTHNRNLQKFSAVRTARHLSTDNKEIAERTEIYYGNLTKQIKALKLFSLLTSTGGLIAQPFFYSKAIESGNTGAILGLFACIGFLAVTTPLVIHLITKKYVTHLYYDAKEDKYIANTYNLFARKKELIFTPKDVVIPDVAGMFTNCIVKGTPLFFEENFFSDTNHFIRIMGYDKPMDFKLTTNDNLNQIDTNKVTNK